LVSYIVRCTLARHSAILVPQLCNKPDVHTLEKWVFHGVGVKEYLWIHTQIYTLFCAWIKPKFSHPCKSAYTGPSFQHEFLMPPEASISTYQIKIVLMINQVR
jgi:hypothetical protein